MVKYVPNFINVLIIISKKYFYHALNRKCEFKKVKLSLLNSCMSYLHSPTILLTND